MNARIMSPRKLQWLMPKGSGWAPKTLPFAAMQVFFRNILLRVIHLAEDEAGSRLLCGRTVTEGFERIEWPLQEKRTASFDASVGGGE